MSLKRRACGKDFEPTSTKPRKKRKRLTLSGWLNFLKFILAFFKRAIHTKDTKWYQPSNIPTLWYEVWKASKLDFFGVEEKERWMCRYEASRPALSRDLACGHPPAQQTPSPQHSYNFKIFCKIKRREDGRVATCNGALEICEIQVPPRPMALPGAAHYKHLQPREQPRRQHFWSHFFFS